MSLPLKQFVYPFTLEPHVITLEASRRTTLAAHTTRREALLRARDDEKERRRRDALRRIAPGFEPGSAGMLLVPTKRESANVGAEGLNSAGPSHGEEVRERDVMDDLVDQLARLDEEKV